MWALLRVPCSHHPSMVGAFTAAVLGCAASETSVGSLHEFCSLVLLLEFRRSSPASWIRLNPVPHPPLAASASPPRGQCLFIHGKDSPAGTAARAQAGGAGSGCCTGFLCHGLFVPFVLVRGRSPGAGLESLDERWGWLLSRDSPRSQALWQHVQVW